MSVAAVIESRFKDSKIQRFINPKDIIKDVWGYYTLIFYKC